MDNKDFKSRAGKLLEYLCAYLENVEDLPTVSAVKPGFLRELLPAEAPEEADDWDDVFADIDNVMMKGINHIKSPHAHPYAPCDGSHASLLATILSDMTNNFSSDFESSPFMMELEDLMLDWLVKLLDLPKHFLSTEQGCGVMQTSGTESIFLSLIYAREKKLSSACDETSRYNLLAKLVCYASEEAHSSSERAAYLGMVKFRKVATNKRNQMSADQLLAAMEIDISLGLVPFFVTACIGTTGVGAVDILDEIGPICRKKGVWLHVDAVYIGAAFICPEYRHYMKGIEFADSFNLNPYKWMLVHCHCSILWLREKQNKNIFSARNGHPKVEKRSEIWHIQQHPLVSGRKTRAVNLWFVMRLYGRKGLQDHIRRDMALAKQMESLLEEDGRFEIVSEVVASLVCFRIKGMSNHLTDRLHDALHKDRRIWLTVSSSKGRRFLRFVIVAEHTKSRHIVEAYKIIKHFTDGLLNQETYL